MTQKEFAKIARDECNNENTTVKHGVKGGFPFWNAESSMFMYVPAFHFTGVRAVRKYRYDAVDCNGEKHSFNADGCCELLTPIWKDIPEGVVRLTVTALDNKDGSDYSLVGARTFFKSASFPETSPAKKCSYKECASKAMDYAMNQSFIKYWLNEGKPDPSYDLNVYPSKMISSLVNAMISYAKICPEKADIALKVAKNAADFLISITPRGNDPLADVPPTYYLDFCPDPEKYGILTPNWHAANSRRDTNMMIYPASAGAMYVNLAKATGEKKYLEEGIKVGTYFKNTIEENGSWFLQRSVITGEPVSKNYIAPIEHVVPLTEALYEATGDKCWHEITEKCIKYTENNLLSIYNWEGQFEDSPLSINYTNLSHIAPVYMAELLAKKGDEESIKTAVELMRFVEDQFVVWGSFYPWSQSSPTGELYDNSKFHSPAGLEQYNWYVPIDASTATCLRGFLALYEAGCGDIYLAKARVLADQITVMQEESGRIPTHWMNTQDALDNFWFNCMFFSVGVLGKIAEYDDVQI